MTIYGFPNIFDAREHPITPPAASGWGSPFAAANVVPEKPAFEETEDNKKLFGVELAKNPQFPFQAACVVFPETQIALWVSRNWIADPIVLASRDLYLEFKELNRPILDKQQLAAKVLREVEAVNPDSKKPLIDAKDRIAGLKLYAEIAGYTGSKADAGASNNTFIHNHMTVKLVRANVKEETKNIEHEPIEDEVAPNPLPLRVKLVSTSR